MANLNTQQLSEPMRLFFKTAIPIFIICLILTQQQVNDKPLDCTQYHCLDGITPGETTFDEALERLNYYHGGVNVTEREYSERCDEVWCFIVWNFGRETVHIGTVKTRANVVHNITVWYGAPRPTIAEIIVRAGEPTSLFIATNPICEHITLIFDNPTEIMSIGVFTPYHGVYPDQSIYRVMLPAPEDSIQTYLTYQGIMLSWQGYVDYCELAAASTE